MARNHWSDPLLTVLRGQPVDTTTVTLTLAEIEAIIGAPLPESVHTSGWWANLRGQQRPQMKAWWSAGWRVAGTMLRTASPLVTFERR